MSLSYNILTHSKAGRHMFCLQFKYHFYKGHYILFILPVLKFRAVFLILTLMHELM